MKPFDKEIFLRRLGAGISKLRKARGMGQDQLTQSAGLSRGAISRIENGLVDPQATTLAKVAGALEIPISKLFEVEAPQ